MRSISMFLLLVYGTSVSAQQSDPEWPCIQVLVPEIVTAVVWPEVIDESLIGSWRQDKTLTALIDKLSDLESFAAPERKLIADFVSSIPTADLGTTLNRLADGIVTRSNQRRSRYISGIKRYTRQQISIANQIETRLNQLAQLEVQPDQLPVAQRSEIEQTLHWHQRVYDQRERAINSLCDRPVELEEMLSNVLRELAHFLP